MSGPSTVLVLDTQSPSPAHKYLDAPDRLVVVTDSPGLARHALSTMVVAPCTANVAAKMACGLADDLLTSLALACRKPKLVAPAMNDGMWENPATQANVAALTARGVRIVSPGVGDLACGTAGAGRMAEPSEILSACCIS